jgi:hypothetical protein
MVLVAGAVAGAGFLLAQAHADSPAVSIEAEAGQITGPATIFSDTTASAGRAVLLNDSRLETTVQGLQ